MMQQYVLLRTENDLLNSLIGQSFNQKTKLEAYKILTEIHSKAQDRSIGKMALCYVLDKNEVLGVGGSTLLKDKKGKIISNLILDQFGIMLASLLRIRTSAQKNVNMKDVSGIDRSMGIYNTSQQFVDPFGLSIGCNVQVGSGSTSPARTDFKIQTPFGTAPESLTFNAVSDPIFNSGLGNFKYIASITAGGSGTINESAFLSFWRDVTGVVRTHDLFRDIISPAQSFIIGQSIALEYTVQL